MSLVIGIDLGTTYCCAAVYEDGEVRTIETQTSENTTPSHVAFDDDGNVSAGSVVKDNSHLNPANCLYDIKRLIGRKYDDPVLQKDKKLWPFQVVDDGHNSPVIKLSNGKTFYPEQITAKLLSFLKAQAEIFLSQKVTKAVITVPAYFNDGQRQATKDAAEIAGLEVLRIINEPTAAAIAYYHQNKNLNGKTILVFDLGGGTFDVSIVKNNGAEITVLGVGGDTHLGGEDFDNALVEHCLEEFKKSVGVDLKADLTSGDNTKRRNANNKIRRLRQQCEKTKIGLSTIRQMPVSLDAMHSDKPLHVIITREKFESLNKAYFDKCLDILKKAIKDSNLDIKNVDEVILVGGSSKIPAIQARVTEFFGGKKPHRNIRGSEAVAFGAAIEASKISPSKNTSLKLQVKDVCPLSIGVEIDQNDGRTYNFHPMLMKNTPVPCRVTQQFGVSEYNMKEEKIDIFEGENPLVEQNHFLGGFKLALPPNCPYGELVVITMELTAEGILHCTAICPRFGTSNQLKVVESKGRLTRSDILRMKTEEVVSARAFSLI